MIVASLLGIVVGVLATRHLFGPPGLAGGLLPAFPDEAEDLEPEIATLLDERAAARAARDFAASDRLRDELAAHGVTVEDTRDGQRWRRTVEAGRG